MSPEETSRARAAADTLKGAIDAHLAACEAKQAEEDPAVQAAYDQVRVAAEAYDDALFDAYDEVTPFEFSSGPLYEPAEVADERLPVRLTILVRRDFAVRSPDELLAAGLTVSGETDLTPLEALGVLLEEAGIDATTDSDDTGLQYLGGATWVLDQDLEDDSLRADPFGDVDPDRLLHKVDEEVLG